MPTPPGALRLEAERLGLEGRRLILEGEPGGSTLERGPRTPLVGPPVSGAAGLSGSGPGLPPPRGAPGRGRPEGGLPGDGSGVPPPPPPGVAPAWGGGAHGAPAAGAFGGPLDLLGSLLERLVAAQEASSRVSAAKGEREMDGRLKLDQRLASIGGEDEVVLVDELEAFEKQMSRANVTTWKQWYRYFEQAVVGRARAWVEEQLAAGQARLLYLGAMEPGALDSAWATLYRFMRGELLKRVGVQYEEPGEMAREQWERLAFSDVVRHYEDIDEVLDKIIMSHTRMYKTGNFRGGDADSQRREMQDLRRKVPRGSRLREIFAVKDYEPTSFRQWVELVQQFASTLSRRTSSRGFGDKHPTHERNRRVDDGGEGDDQNGQGVTPGEAPEDGGPETGGNDLWGDDACPVRRTGDNRPVGQRGRGAQVRTGGAGRGRGAVGRGAASVPWCPTCQGRHLLKTCPNVCAKGDPTFSAPAVDRDGATCSYVDPRCPDVVCRGRGHFARHHVQGESEGVDAQKGVSPPRGAAIVRPNAARNDGVPARVGASGPQRGRPVGRGAPGQSAARGSGAVGSRPGGDSSRAVPARPVQPQRFPARVVTFGDECGDEELWPGEEPLPEEEEGAPEFGDELEPQFEAQARVMESGVLSDSADEFEADVPLPLGRGFGIIRVVRELAGELDCDVSDGGIEFWEGESSTSLSSDGGGGVEAVVVGELGSPDEQKHGELLSGSASRTGSELPCTGSGPQLNWGVGCWSLRATVPGCGGCGCGLGGGGGRRLWPACRRRRSRRWSVVRCVCAARAVAMVRPASAPPGCRVWGGEVGGPEPECEPRPERPVRLSRINAWRVTARLPQNCMADRCLVPGHRIGHGDRIVNMPWGWCHVVCADGWEVVPVGLVAR